MDSLLVGLQDDLPIFTQRNAAYGIWRNLNEFDNLDLEFERILHMVYGWVMFKWDV